MIILFTLALIWLFIKVLFVGIKLMWNLSKFFVGLILFPAILVFLFVIGAVYLAFPLLIVAGIIAVIAGLSHRSAEVA